jgi:large repetitive protein
LDSTIRSAQRNAVGNVFVADSDNDVLKEIPNGNGSYSSTRSIGSSANRPLGVAFDHLGRQYVVDAAGVSVLFP